MLALVLAMALCLCVCLSVTSWSSIETAELIGLVFVMEAKEIWVPLKIRVAFFGTLPQTLDWENFATIGRSPGCRGMTIQRFFSKWRPSAILKITKIIFNFYSWLIFSSSVVFCGDLGWNTGWAVKEFSCKGLFIAHKLNWTGVRGLEFVRCEHVSKLEFSWVRICEQDVNVARIFCL